MNISHNKILFLIAFFRFKSKFIYIYYIVHFFFKFNYFTIKPQRTLVLILKK